MLDRKQKIRAKAEGDAIVAEINGQIDSAGFTHAALADAVGCSDSCIGLILNPLHDAGWKIEKLPALLRILPNPKRVVRQICTIVGQTSVDLPAGARAVGPVVAEVGQLLEAISAGMKDGMTVGEAECIRQEMLDVFSAVNRFIHDNKEVQQ